VLVIDQLEEIFSDASVTPGQRQAYVRLLLTLARSGLVWIIATLRSDYYQRCAELPDLMALKKDGTYDLAPPSPAELQQIITRPAAMAGLRFELQPQRGEPLDQDIFNAVLGMEAGLPLLEYTLEELYERRTPRRVGSPIGPTPSWAGWRGPWAGGPKRSLRPWTRRCRRPSRKSFRN
jgi:hypothetical protein